MMHTWEETQQLAITYTRTREPGLLDQFLRNVEPFIKSKMHKFVSAGCVVFRAQGKFYSVSIPPSLADPDDLSQEVMLTLIKRLPQYNPEKSAISSFLNLVIATRVPQICRQFYSTPIRAPPGEMLIGISVNEPYEGPNGKSRKARMLFQEWGLPDPKSMRFVEGIEMKVDLQAAMNRLLPNQQRVIALRYGTKNGIEATCQEMAEEMGITRAAVNATKLRAIAGLRETLCVGGYRQLGEITVEKNDKRTYRARLKPVE